MSSFFSVFGMRSDLARKKKINVMEGGLSPPPRIPQACRFRKT